MKGFVSEIYTLLIITDMCSVSCCGKYLHLFSRIQKINVSSEIILHLLLSIIFQLSWSKKIIQAQEFMVMIINLIKKYIYYLCSLFIWSVFRFQNSSAFRPLKFLSFNTSPIDQSKLSSNLAYYHKLIPFNNLWI